MSAARTRWLRNARTPEVIASSATGVTLQLQNIATDERVKVELDFYQIDGLMNHIREAAEKQAKQLEAHAAEIRRLTGLTDRNF